MYLLVEKRKLEKIYNSEREKMRLRNNPKNNFQIFDFFLFEHHKSAPLMLRDLHIQFSWRIKHLLIICHYNKLV